MERPPKVCLLLRLFQLRIGVEIHVILRKRPSWTPFHPMVNEGSCEWDEGRRGVALVYHVIKVREILLFSSEFASFLAYNPP